jgi:hypothetical protein
MKFASIIAIIFYALIALCSSNPLVEQQPELRLDFTNDLIADLFSYLAQLKFGFESDYINQLITKHRIIIEKQRLDIHSIFYNNTIADSFINLAIHTAHYLQKILNDLLSKPFTDVGMQSIDVEKVETAINQSIATLIRTFRIFAYKALIISNDRQQLDELVQIMNSDIEAIIGNLTEEIIEFIPVSLAEDFDKVFGILQSMFHYWTISLARLSSSVTGPFGL